jgi:hypothetical protein
MIANDKFCLIRFTRLHLSWSRQPKRGQHPRNVGMGYPSPKEQRSCQEGIHATQATIMDDPASIPRQS